MSYSTESGEVTLDGVTRISADDSYYNLGSHSRPITTSSRAAQVWFDRGLNWCYAFNHGAAYKCFEQAVAHDRECAMAYWGLAYAAGPNYNKSWGIFDTEDLNKTMCIGYKASQRATELLASASGTEEEKAIIRAMALRFPSATAVEDYESVNLAYDRAMRHAFELFPEDMDIISLYVDAKMMIAQRKMFDIETGEPIESSPVRAIMALFKKGLARPEARFHPGILHFSIHFWEMSATPAVALPAADHLRSLVPDAGHLHHMPSHLDVLVGDYRRSIASNSSAIAADNLFLAQEGAKNMYSFYRLHNYHSLIYAAMLGGQSQIALEALSPMESSLTEDVLRIDSPPLADWLEFFLSVRVHVYVRFGMWAEIKALALPTDQQLYCTTTVMIHYGKGIAYAATGDIVNAVKERELFDAARSRVSPNRRDYPNLITDILGVAEAMLDGELEYRRGNFIQAFEHLREAVKRDNSLLYTEPWGWMVPTRHAYAALSLEQGMIQQAAQAYAEDLGLDQDHARSHQHPHNVWALHGYHECLTRLGRTAEATIIKQQLDYATQVADIEIQSSCFCRLESASSETTVCCK